MKKKSIMNTLYSIVLVIFIVSTAIFLYLSLSSYRSQNDFHVLSEQVNKSADILNVGEIKTPDSTVVLKKYEEIYDLNKDLFGWLKIDGTNIDYPVMFTPDDPEFYFRKSFNKTFSYAGVPFIDGGCKRDPRSDNLIIYGHNMADKTMFSHLLNYQKQEFYEKHPQIHFDTLYEESDYEVIAAFPAAILDSGSDRSDFFRYVDFEYQTDFTIWKDSLKKASLYSINTEFTYGDQFITLITCSYHVNNGRFVVVAKKIMDS